MPEENNPFVVPTDPKALIKWLDAKRETGKTRVPELNMKRNLAFMLGHQWLVWDANHRQFRRPRTQRNDPNAPIRLTINKIAGIAERIIAKLTKSSPIPEARPVSDSNDDVSAAKVSTRILTHELHRLDWESWLTEFYFWPMTLGWSYAQVRWNPEAGKEVGEDDKGKLFEGEVELEQVPAFELSVDPNARTLKSAQWAVRSTTMTREAVWERWGVLIPAAKGESARTLTDEVFALSDESSDRHASKADQVKVHQMWLRPGSRAQPKGMVVTWTGDRVLEEPKPFPYDHGHLPFVQFNLLPGLGTREGRTFVDDLIPMQVDYNDARSREAMIRRTLTPKLLAPVGSIDKRKVSSRVEVLTYNPTGAEPRYHIPDSGWIAQYETGMERSNNEMGERAGQGDASQGEAPGSMAAAAIMALQEADDTKLALSAKELATGVEQVGWQILMLARQFWSEERTVRAWSEDGQNLEVGRFRGADVGHQLDIHLSSESALPRSKSARASLVMQMVEMGLITDPRQIVRLLDLPGVDAIVEHFDLDAKKQQRELAKMIDGDDAEVDTFDGHAIHIEELDKFRKSVEYEELDDRTKARIDAHHAVHTEVMGQLSAATQAAAQAGAAGQMEQQSESGGLGTMLNNLAQGGIDPMTGGAGPDPLAAAAGQTAGVGSPGNAGIVPGMDMDTQLGRQGQ